MTQLAPTTPCDWTELLVALWLLVVVEVLVPVEREFVRR
jgi:hypothetical protein